MRSAMISTPWSGAVDETAHSKPVGNTMREMRGNEIAGVMSVARNGHRLVRANDQMACYDFFMRAQYSRRRLC